MGLSLFWTRSCVAWAVSFLILFKHVQHLIYLTGVGTLHAWETFGDGITPDIQGVAKGLGAG